MAVASYVQTRKRKRNNYLCINCICTRVDNVPNSSPLSFSLSLGEVIAVPHRRIAERVRRICAIVHVPSRVCKQNVYLYTRQSVCCRATDPHLCATRRCVSPRRSLRIARITTMHILQRPSIPVRIMSFKRTRCRTPRCVKHRKRTNTIFLSLEHSFVSLKNLTSFIFLLQRAIEKVSM